VPEIVNAGGCVPRARLQRSTGADAAHFPECEAVAPRTHTLVGYPGEMVSSVSVVGTERD